MTLTTTETAGLIAIDWGTTNRRGYLLNSDGKVLSIRQDNRGILNLGSSSFIDLLNEFIKDWRSQTGRERPVLMSGMIGSQQGWVEAPYAACPVRKDDLIRDFIPVPGVNNCWIIPGVHMVRDAMLHDVMRGEEVQIFGAVDLTNQGSATLCLPGTHSKWAKVENGQLIEFTTSMTGEVFHVMCEYSILGALIDKAANHHKKAFMNGVEASAREGGLLAHLFSVRANGLFRILDESAQSSYLSGILIGHEIRSLSEIYASESGDILLVGSPELTALYSLAMTQLCVGHQQVDGSQAVIRGISSFWSAHHKF